METEVTIKIYQQVVVDLESKSPKKEEYTFKVAVTGKNSKESFSFEKKTFRKRDKDDDISEIIDCVRTYLYSELK